MNLPSKLAAMLLILPPHSLYAQSAEPAPPAPSSSPAPAIPTPDAAGAYRVGGEVSPPQVTRKMSPEFSDEAIRRNVTGTCVIQLIIDVEGKPRDLKVIQSIANGLPASQRFAALSLDANAIRAVKQYRFKPALYKGQPVPVLIKIEVAFSRL